MRVFFALELDSRTILNISDWRDRDIASPGRAVPPANFHITLAFIGTVDNSILERLCLSIDAWLTDTPITGAEIELDRVGYWQKQGIFWLGCSSYPPQLSSLAERLKHLSTSVGCKRDRNIFQPHVTLYRSCTGAPTAPTTIPPITISYRHFVLFESIQGKSGVNYRVVQDWDLPAATCKAHPVIG